MVLNLFLLVIMIILTIIASIKVKKKKERLTVLLISILIIILYTVFSFGLSFTAKTSYEIYNLFNDYEYVTDYSVNNQSIVISMKEKNENTRIYNITVLNKITCLYYVSNKKYDKESILILENKDFELLSVNIDSQKYYFIDFNDSKINSLQINNQIIYPTDKSYCVFHLEENLYSLRIDNNDYSWYIVDLPN